MVSGYTIEAANTLNDLFGEEGVRFLLGLGGSDLLIVHEARELGISTLEAEDLITRLQKVPPSEYIKVLHTFKGRFSLK